MSAYEAGSIHGEDDRRPHALPTTRRPRPWWSDRRGVGLGLGLLMALTRLAHVGHDFQPIDASWAVFLLAGAFLPASGAFFALCAEAAAIDFVALSLGIDRACLSPAYLSLLPAYGALWWAGRLAARSGSRSCARVAAAAVLGATLAFAITNAGYFMSSPEVAGMPLPAFVAGVSSYYPWYVATTLIYSTCGCALARWARPSSFPQPAASLDAA